MKRYLDNGATTRVDDEVLKEMLPFFTEHYGNASSMHTIGQNAKEALEESREKIADSIGANPNEIIFTSGGTESNNFAIKGVALAKGAGHIITTKIEHDCVLNACKWLEKRGFDVTYLNVDNEGFVDIEQLKKSIRKDTILVSVIHGNNEIGTIQDIDAIGKICKENKIYFHTDACQSYTKVPITVENIDLMTINSHKIHGPKGVGALFIKKGTRLDPLFHGGGHEFKKRSGTENVSGIVGFAKAVEIGLKTDYSKVAELRDNMIEKVSKEIDNVILTGAKEGSKRLPNNVNFIFKFIEGEGILMYMDGHGVSVSTGSACSSNSLEPSHVMIACGFKHELAHGSIRFTLSKYTNKEEIDYTIEKLKETVKKLRKMSPLTR